MPKYSGNCPDFLKHDTLHIYLALYQLPDHVRNVIPQQLVLDLEDVIGTGTLSFPAISLYGRNIASVIAYTYLKASGAKVRLADYFPALTRKQQDTISGLKKTLLETYEYTPSDSDVILPQWPHYRLCVYLDRRVQGISAHHPLPIIESHSDYCLAIANQTHLILSAPISFGDYLFDQNGKLTGIQCATSVIDRTFDVLEGPIEMNSLSLNKAFTFEKKEKSDTFKLWMFRRYELVNLEDVLKLKYGNRNS
ncbi:MAG: hypothetical protein IJM15_00795 [Erysipelotrichaceae bacterium]|nr:hypothetical protein [Erysipelotrichaceae bacterium]